MRILRSSVGLCVFLILFAYGAVSSVRGDSTQAMAEDNYLFWCDAPSSSIVILDVGTLKWTVAERIDLEKQAVNLVPEYRKGYEWPTTGTLLFTYRGWEPHFRIESVKILWPQGGGCVLDAKQFVRDILWPVLDTNVLAFAHADESKSDLEVFRDAKERCPEAEFCIQSLETNSALLKELGNRFRTQSAPEGIYIQYSNVMFDFIE